MEDDVLIRDTGIMIPKDFYLKDQILNSLTKTMRAWDGSLHESRFFLDRGDYFLIPRYYNAMPLGVDIINNKFVGEEIKIDAKITPRNIRQKLAIDFLKNNASGVLKLEPGSGKTVISIAAISDFKKKSLICVHKKNLLCGESSGWKSELLKFTNLTNDDIAVLDSKHYEEQLKRPIILCTPQIFLYRVKHHDEKFLRCLRDAKIGFTMFDECHVMGAEAFSMASMVIASEKMFGISATPYRSDGMHEIITMNLGNIVYFRPEDGELLKPKIFMIFFPFGIYEGKYKMYLTWGGMFQSSRYFNKLKTCEKYISTVSEIIKKSYEVGHRTILVLGKQRDQLLELARNTGIDKSRIGIFIPTSTPQERLEVSDTDNLEEAFHKKNIVFGTYTGCRDGNNRADFDSLIMASPNANIEQSIGRVQRLMDGKRQPYIYDIIDTQGPMHFIPDRKSVV